MIQHESAHVPMLRHFGWDGRVELGLEPEWDGAVARTHRVGDGHTYSPLASAMVYAPALMVLGSDWESDAFAHDRANVAAAMPGNWPVVPDAWLSKVHDEA